MKNYLPFFIVIFLLLTFGVVGLVVLSKNQNPSASLSPENNEKRELSVEQNQKPKENFGDQKTTSQKEEFKIIYQDPNDTEGRTILYDLKSEKQNTGYPGIGVVNAQELVPTPRHFVGLFSEWKTIDGSRDKYLLLYDPVNRRQLPPVRVAFESSELFKHEMTALSVENMNMLKQAKKHIFLISKKFSDLSDEKLSKFIVKGDAVAVLLYYDIVTSKMKTDYTDNYLAGWVYIRRNKGLADLND